MTPISAVLITLNEKDVLRAALQSVAFCDETIVVDAGSSDATRALAEEVGARVVLNTPWPGFLAQKNFALEQARHDWVLALDADERVTPALRREIQALQATGPAAAGYRMPRLTFYLGRWIRATDWYPDFQLRLFDRRRGRWDGGRVHESVKLQGPAGRLRGELEHHPYTGIAEHVQRIDRYTTLWAEQAFEDGHRAGPLDLLGTATWAFARNYLFRGGFRLGTVGLIISGLNSYYTFLKQAKLIEMSRRAAGAR